MKKIIIAMGFLGILAGSTTAVFAGYFVNTPIARCDTQITRTLQVGSENNDVFVLQSMLSHSGYLNANPNGYFGYATKTAVKRFQSANGISTTGTVGETTRNAVNERLCDSDVRGDTLSYNDYSNYGYGYGDNSGVTYVNSYDPYVRVISPQVTTPAVYATPQENTATSFSNSYNTVGQYSSNGYTTSASSVLIPSSNGYISSSANIAIPSSNSQVQSTSIVYNPSMGYTYGIVPQTGSLIVTTPLAHVIYNEGDTVYLAWTTNNLNATTFQIVLENSSTGQKKIATIVSGNSASFVLTKELLDSVCAGACDNNQQGSFKIAITTPTTDIAGITSTLRAAVEPVTIRRPYSTTAVVTISASKTPVNSGETFKLYVNAPTVSGNNQSIGNYSIKIRAICQNSVQVSIAGVTCGQYFTIPVAPVSYQQEIPAVITNPVFFKQDVTFEIIVANLRGDVIGSSQTVVSVNAAPFSF